MSIDLQEKRIKVAKGLDVIDVVQDMDKKHYPGFLDRASSSYLSKLGQRYPGLMDPALRAEIYMAYRYMFSSITSTDQFNNALIHLSGTLPAEYTEAQKLPFWGWACALMGRYIHAIAYLMQAEACNMAGIDSYSEYIRRNAEGDIEASRILSATYAQYIETFREVALEVYISLYK